MALLRDHLHFSLSLTINVHKLVFKCPTCFLRHFLSSSNHNHYTELLRVGFTYCLPKYFGSIGFPDFLFLVAMLKWPVRQQSNSQTTLVWRSQWLQRHHCGIISGKPMRGADGREKCQVVNSCLVFLFFCTNDKSMSDFKWFVSIIISQ